MAKYERLNGLFTRLKKLQPGREFTDEKLALRKELQEMFENEFDTHDELLSKIDRLEIRIAELEEKIKEIENKLALGQVTWLLEQNVAKFILPKNEKFGLLSNWNDIEGWLKRNGQTRKGKKQKQLLIDTLSLGPEYEGEFVKYREVMKRLRKLRNPIAHPSKVSLKDARLQIQKYLPQKRRECLYIIKIVEKLNCMMRLGKLASSFQEDVVSFVYNRKETRGIQAMDSWLKDNPENRRAPELRKRWAHLTDGLKKWTRSHEHALEVMLSLNRNIAVLQDVDLDTTKKYIVDFAPKKLKDQCIDIINTMKKLNGLRLGELAFNFQKHLLKYVIPKGSQETVAEMIDWLGNTERDPNRDEALKRWKNITGSVVWTLKHTQALTALVALKGEVRISQSIEVETAIIHIVDYVRMDLIQKGIEILKMIEPLRKARKAKT